MKKDFADIALTGIIILAALVIAVQLGIWHGRKMATIENCEYFVIQKGAK